MKRFAWLALVSSWLLACGGGGGLPPGSGIPQAEACNQAAATFCTKVYSCTDTNSTIVKLYLQNEANCETLILQYCGATGFQCTAGATYHGDTALQCKDGFNAQTCETISAGLAQAVSGMSMAAAVASLTAHVPACSKICTGGAGGAGGAG